MRFRTLALWTTVVTYLTILLGGFVRGSGAGLGCETWPRCTQESFFPVWSDRLALIEWNHRFVALVAGFAILGSAIAAWRGQRHDRRVVAASTIAAVLLPFQVVLGGLTVESGLHPSLSALHMGTAAGIFGAVVATTIFAYYPRSPSSTGSRAGRADDEPDETSGPASASLTDYVAMTKPRIISLLVVMGFTGMVLAPEGLSLGPVEMAVTLLGGALAAGAGGAINQVIERDVDSRMERTRDRGVASGRIAPGNALAFGLVLAAVGFTLQALVVNVLVAVLTLLSLLLYVFVYTLWLKPTTPQGVVIGGAAGSMPALIGWAAVTNDIGWPAVLLALVVFLWQPPHFWALSIAHRGDYAHAGFPMMPLVRGVDSTKRQMVLYALATIIAAALFYTLGYLGPFYLFASSVLGAAFLAATLRLVRTGQESAARSMFLVSIAYLFLLLVAMVADRALMVAS